MALTQDHIKGLDHLRQRLSQLSSSINTLRTDLERNEPLPTWPSLQSSAQALSFNLQQLLETFNAQRQFLREAHAYPLTSFPGHTQEGLLGQLMRKRLEPGVQSWIEEYAGPNTTAANGEGGLKQEEIRELWNWAPVTSSGIVEPMLEDGGDFENDFTIAEKEGGIDNVVTGLRRKLDGEFEDDDDEDEDVEGDKMDEGMPASKGKVPAEDEGVETSLAPIPLDNVLKFMTTGTAPRPPNR